MAEAVTDDMPGPGFKAAAAPIAVVDLDLNILICKSCFCYFCVIAYILSFELQSLQLDTTPADKPAGTAGA